MQEINHQKIALVETLVNFFLSKKQLDRFEWLKIKGYYYA